MLYFIVCQDFYINKSNIFFKFCLTKNNDNNNNKNLRTDGLPRIIMFVLFR